MSQALPTSADATAVAADAASARPARRFAHFLTLFAVGLVVVLVSLPQLRDFALRENQGDARALVRRLSRELKTSSAANVQALLQGAPDLPRLATDTETLAGGAVLRRHGYLFDVATLPGGGRAVRAWPWSFRSTGIEVYAGVAGGTVYEHDNRDGRWSGPAAAPELAGLTPASGWRSESRQD